MSNARTRVAECAITVRRNSSNVRQPLRPVNDVVVPAGSAVSSGVSEPSYPKTWACRSTRPGTTIMPDTSISLRACASACARHRRDSVARYPTSITRSKLFAGSITGLLVEPGRTPAPKPASKESHPSHACSHECIINQMHTNRNPASACRKLFQTTGRLRGSPRFTCTRCRVEFPMSTPNWRQAVH